MIDRIFAAVSRTIVVAGAFASMACAAPGEQADNISDSGNDRTALRVALLTPGPVTDQSWNRGAYEGLMQIRDSLGARVSHIQTKTPAEFDENFRQYGTQGYNLVFGHGFEFQDAAARIAPQFPKTVYVVTSGRVTGPNVAGVGFAFEEASYQAGMLAATMSKSGMIGLIGGQKMPPVVASFTAFERGARSINPAIRVITSFIGNWDDMSAGKEQALTQIGRGVDVIFQNADAAGLGVFQAARERNILVFGTNGDQNSVAPDVIIASVVIDLPKALMRIAREVQSGSFKGRVIQYGMAEDIIRLTINPVLADRVPATARAAIDSVGALILAGKFRAIDDVLAGADTAKPIAR